MESKRINCSQDAAFLLYPNVFDLDHEEAWVIYLTTENCVIGAEMVSKGTLTKTAIDSRTILRQALLHNAASIILCHNHPSGSEKPSQADINMTENLKDACKLMDIPLLDHIIVGQNRYYSFADEEVTALGK